MMERLTGPECPSCGCCDGRSAGIRQWFGREIERVQCRNCGKIHGDIRPAPDPDQELHVEQATAVPEGPTTYHAQPVRCICPVCGAVNPAVRRTIKQEFGPTLRYHRCDSCSQTFKSAER